MLNTPTCHIFIIELLSLLLLYAWSASSADTQTVAPHFLPKRTGIVQLFEWKYADVAVECEQFLGPKGFAGVQLSPVTEHLVVRTDKLQRPWWERYEPISYRLVTRSGGESDFLKMSHTCNEAGVRVYVEVVLNHMARAFNAATEEGAELLLGSADGTANASSYEYPDVPYTRDDFHKQCQVTPHSSGKEVRNCQLDGRPDLDHSRVNVRETIIELLNGLVDMGVAGFFINSAKYMWPNDIKGIMDQVKDLNTEFGFPENERPLVYQDVQDMGMGSVSKTEYTPNGLVTESLSPVALATIFHRKAPLTSLINWGPAMGFVAHQDSVVFVDSPQAQRGFLTSNDPNPLLTYREVYKYIQAHVFMLAHPYGRIKRLMSSYYFDPDQVKEGPPSTDDADDSIRSPEFDSLGQCDAASGWVCEHRWEPIAHMIELANQLDDVEDGVTNFQTDGLGHIAFCRGRKAFIAINRDGMEGSAYMGRMQTCLDEGVYCDVTSGELNVENGPVCMGKRITVEAEGWANIELAPVFIADEEDAPSYTILHSVPLPYYGTLAIHVGSKIHTVKPSIDDDNEVESKGRLGSPEELSNEESDKKAEENASVANMEEEDEEEISGSPKVPELFMSSESEQENNKQDESGINQGNIQVQGPEMSDSFEEKRKILFISPPAPGGFVKPTVETGEELVTDNEGTEQMALAEDEVPQADAPAEGEPNAEEEDVLQEDDGLVLVAIPFKETEKEEEGDEVEGDEEGLVTVAADDEADGPSGAILPQGAAKENPDFFNKLHDDLDKLEKKKKGMRRAVGGKKPNSREG